VASDPAGGDPQDAARASSASRFDRPTVLMLSGAHLAHDIYLAFIGVLLPLMIDKLGISLAMAGILASGARWTTSIQPVLGHWADKTDTRYWVIFAPTVTAVCMSLFPLSPNFAIAVGLVAMAGLSHAAFHPASGALTTRASGGAWGRGMSYYMTGGEIGRVVGPVFIAGIVAVGGLGLSPVAAIPGIAASVVLYRRFHRADAVELAGGPPARIMEAIRDGGRSLGLLSAAIVVRSFTNTAIVVFYPTFVTGLDRPLLLAGVALTLYEVGAVVGTFAGGTISDRVGRVRVLVGGLVLALPALVAAIVLGPSVLGLAVLTVAGLLLLSASSIELVLVQRLLPENRSTAVGISYFMRSGGGIAATIGIGALGQAVGLRAALLVAIAVGALALPVTLGIRDPERVPGA
jgi:MFS transporter, FSR family, fosmidomycin resistance protein